VVKGIWGVAVASVGNKEGEGEGEGSQLVFG